MADLLSYEKKLLLSNSEESESCCHSDLKKAWEFFLQLENEPEKLYFERKKLL